MPPIQIKSIFLLVIGLFCILFGISFTSVLSIGVFNYFVNPGEYGDFGKFMFAYGWIGIPFLIIGIVIFYKSPLIRKLLGYE